MTCSLQLCHCQSGFPKGLQSSAATPLGLRVVSLKGCNALLLNAHLNRHRVWIQQRVAVRMKNEDFASKQIYRVTSSSLSYWRRPEMRPMKRIQISSSQSCSEKPGKHQALCMAGENWDAWGSKMFFRSEGYHAGFRPDLACFLIPLCQEISLEYAVPI